MWGVGDSVGSGARAGACRGSKETFESANDIFTKAFTQGFAWEVGLPASRQPSALSAQPNTPPALRQLLGGT